MNYSIGEASSADAVVAVFGISGIYEGEEGESTASTTRGDRLDLNLPQNQLDYLRELKKECKKPIILVLTGGSPICTPELSEIADVILFAWYPGQEGGRAVADAIFGDINPSGRLSITFPKSVNQLPTFEDYSMKGRTYRYMTDEPLYPFGFGLSYTSYTYNNIKTDKVKVKRGQSVKVSATVTNAGKASGEEVVQLYITDLKTSVPAPIYSLKSMKRIKLAAGESKVVTFDITPQMMELVTENGNKVIEPGDFRVYVAGSTPSELSKKLGAAIPISTIFSVK
jgi:beta-glucosidase